MYATQEQQESVLCDRVPAAAAEGGGVSWLLFTMESQTTEAIKRVQYLF